MNKLRNIVVLIILIIILAVGGVKAFAAENYKLQAMTNKSVYQPGETVTVYGTLKYADSQPASGMDVVVEVNTTNARVFAGQQATDDEGKFQISFLLDQQALSGSYRVSCAAAGLLVNTSLNVGTAENKPGGAGETSNNVDNDGQPVINDPATITIDLPSVISQGQPNVEIKMGGVVERAILTADALTALIEKNKVLTFNGTEAALTISASALLAITGDYLSIEQK